MIAINDSIGIDEDHEEGDGTRFLSIDPLAAKYPSMSPYVFVGNMPITFIDPDGRKITLYYQTGKIDKNGNHIIAKWVYGSTSKIPDNEFIKQTAAAIDKAYQVDISYVEGVESPQQILKTMINDQNKNVKIIQSDKFESALHKRPRDNNGVPLTLETSRGVIVTEIEYNPKVAMKYNNSTEYSEAGVSIWHELVHAYNFLWDKKNYFERKNDKTINKKWGSKEEQYVIENHEKNYMLYYCMKLRTDHYGEPYYIGNSTDSREILTPQTVNKNTEIKLNKSETKW